MQIFFISLILFLLGLAILIYGYRIFMVMLPAWGFLAGFWLGGDITALTLGTEFLGTTSGWVAAFVLGLVFAITSYFFYSAAVVFLAAVIGYGFGAGLMAALIGPGTGSALVGILVAAVIAVLAIGFKLQKLVVITITALMGSNVILLSAFLLFNIGSLQSIQSTGTTIIPFVENSWLWILAWFALAGVGVGSQLRVNRDYEFQRNSYSQDWG